MSYNNPAGAGTNGKKAARLPIWLPLLLIVLMLLGYVYYDHLREHEQAVNRNYFSELASISLRFRQKLEQLDTLTSWDTKGFSQSNQTRIKTLFPSARQIQLAHCQLPPASPAPAQTQTELLSLPGVLALKDNRIIFPVTNSGNAASNSDAKVCWQLDLADLMDSDKRNFSQLLLVHKDNSILADTGTNPVLSVVNVDEFSKQIAVELNRDWLQLLSNSGKNSNISMDEKVLLPGFSHYLDIQINPGAYRLYFYPFRLGQQPVFLLGVLPSEKLSSNSSERWTWGQWLLGMISLVFAWVMLRLFLLSVHQTVDELFYRITMYSTYLLFIAVVALSLAYAQMQLEKSDKALRAFELAERTANNLDSDLHRIFTQLKPLHSFYNQLITDHSLDKALTQEALHQQLKKHSPWLDIENQPMTLTCNSEPRSNRQAAIWTVFDAARFAFTDTNISQCAGEQPPMTAHTEFAFEPTLIQASLVDGSGVQRGPRFSYVEQYGSSKFSDLSRRQYFQTVRQGLGWPVADYAPDWGGTLQFYIQRLRNIEDGTLGTTLGLALPKGGQFFEIVGDIFLPSLQIPEDNARHYQDFIRMVIDRRSGDVLFHDQSRYSLTEKLDSGDLGTEALRFSLQAERDSKRYNEEADIRPLSGHYHGFPGWFVHVQSKIKPWSVVVFIPSDALNNYMTNMFWLNFVLLLSCCAVSYITVALVRRLVDTGKVKTALHIPLVIDRRKLVLFTSVLTAAILTGYWCGAALDYSMAKRQFFAVFMALLYATLGLLWGSWHFWRMSRENRHIQLRVKPIRVGIGWFNLLLVFTAASVLLTFYLNQLGPANGGALSWYYQELSKSRQNATAQWQQEIRNRYFYHSQVNTQKMGQALPDVPLQDRGIANARKPEDIMSFGHFTQLTDIHEWLQRYVFGRRPSGADTDIQRNASPWPNILLVSAGMVLLIVLWVGLNRDVLYVRLFGSLNLLRHLNRLHQQVKSSKYHSPDPKLCIFLRSVYQKGQSLDRHVQQYQQHNRQAISLTDKLLALCPLFSRDNLGSFCGIRIAIEWSQNRYHLCLYNLEHALEDLKARGQLLDLLNQLKALKEQDKLAGLDLYCDYHCLRKVNATANLPGEGNRELMPALEYMAWADCLKDFTVQNADQDILPLDVDFIAKEVQAMPMLHFVYKELVNMPEPKVHKVYHDLRWLTLRDEQKTADEWSAVHRILLKAEALFRFWWSACSPAEKLALYYLSYGKRVNPNNVVVLEQLAANGLIIVRHGRIRIANQSFAYFVRHAESVENLKAMILQGNIGHWHQYRLPITLMAVVLLVALGIFSGNSLYMVISSLLGLLGLVGNLLGSVNFIRSNVGQ
ncbi:hypothetical protein [Bowmanella denitrificans]|uniref:hypothetical protein n=1 Tax=Bowmanella denitrificans TaxID=366582 RepID=UPI000C9BA88C|nr:hypothetical protein [Bowmanella denitrificans]